MTVMTRDDAYWRRLRILRFISNWEARHFDLNRHVNSTRVARS